MTQSQQTSEGTILRVILLARTNLNVPVRLAYFFLPAISRGLGISLGAASVLVSARSLAGVSAPLFGVLSDRRGAFRLMVVGLSLLILGTVIIVGFPWYAAVLIGFVVLGLAKSAYDPAMQSFVGRRVPYEQRGRALGIIELSWSGALLWMPVCGWLIENVGWSAPFALVTVLGVIAWWVTRRKLAPDPEAEQERQTRVRQGDQGWSALIGSISRMLADRDTRLALSITVLLLLAQDNLMVVYGAWVEQTYDLSLTALGLVTLVFGMAELFAELGVAFMSDRLGKRRAVFLGVALTMTGYLLLPNLTQGLATTMAGTAFLILAFEFSVVGLIPIISGLSATSRGTLMSLNVTAASVGRMIGAPLAVALYQPGDITRNGLVSAGICLLLLVLLSRLREGGH